MLTPSRAELNRKSLTVWTRCCSGFATCTALRSTLARLMRAWMCLLLPAGTLHSAVSDEGTSNSPDLFLGVYADNSDLRFQLPASSLIRIVHVDLRKSKRFHVEFSVLFIHFIKQNKHRYMQTPKTQAGFSWKDRSGKIAWQCAGLAVSTHGRIGMSLQDMLCRAMVPYR